MQFSQCLGTSSGVIIVASPVLYAKDLGFGPRPTCLLISTQHQHSSGDCLLLLISFLESPGASFLGVSSAWMPVGIHACQFQALDGIYDPPSDNQSIALNSKI